MSSSNNSPQPPGPARSARRAARRASCALHPAPLVALLACAAALPGCAYRMHPPVDARDAMQRIADNYAGIERPLTARPALVSFEFRDEEGRRRSIIAQPATIIFAAPRCLYFDVKSTLAGSVARIGSDNSHYWLWVDTPDYRKLWWGTWDALERQRAAPGDALTRPLVVPPDSLLDALLLRAVPRELPGGVPPLLVEVDGRQRLQFQRFDAHGWPYVARELILDRRPPYLPAQIIDRRDDGEVVMDAVIGRYQRIGGGAPTAPYVPRRYVVRWPLDDATMRLDVRDVQIRMSEVPFCEFPAGWEGPSEYLDDPVPALTGPRSPAPSASRGQPAPEESS